MAAKESLMQYIEKLEDILERYFLHKAPEMPEGLKNAIVVFMPWVMIVIVVLSLPTIIALFGGAAFLPFTYVGQVSYGFMSILSHLFGIAAVVFEVMAIPGLLNKTVKGWKLLFYSALLGLISSLLMGNIFGFIISFVISMYIIFQIKEKYR
ncbi:MAG: hypothetical protein ACOCXQ_03720 [Patescibacteria group bacterium]